LIFPCKVNCSHCNYSSWRLANWLYWHW